MSGLHIAYAAGLKIRDLVKKNREAREEKARIALYKRFHAAGVLPRTTESSWGIEKKNI